MKNPVIALPGRHQRGVSIVEALVALVVIAVGMLGIAGLYLSSLQASRTAKLRTQAVQLAGSLADRIRANRDAAAAYATSTYGGAPATHDCVTTSCSHEDLAEDDLARWITEIQGTMPGAAAATGVVTVVDRARPDFDSYVITVNWREANSDIDYSYVLPLSMANRL